MEVILDKPFENKLLERTEIKFRVTFDGPTPKMSEIKSAIADKLKVNPDLMVFRNVRNLFGLKSVQGKVHIYKSAEKMKEVEPAYIIKRYVKGEESGVKG